MTGWQELRSRALEYYGRRCMCCGNTYKTIHVDHIYAKSHYETLSNNFKNLQVLCETCNISKSNTWYKDYRVEERNLKLYNTEKQSEIIKMSKQAKFQKDCIDHLRLLKENYKSRSGRLTKKNKARVRNEQKSFRMAYQD